MSFQKSLMKGSACILVIVFALLCACTDAAGQAVNVNSTGSVPTINKLAADTNKTVGVASAPSSATSGSAKKAGPCDGENASLNDCVLCNAKFLEFNTTLPRHICDTLLHAQLPLPTWSKAVGYLLVSVSGLMVLLLGGKAYQEGAKAEFERIQAAKAARAGLPGAASSARQRTHSPAKGTQSAPDDIEAGRPAGTKELQPVQGDAA